MYVAIGPASCFFIILHPCEPYAIYLDHSVSLWALRHISLPLCIPVDLTPCFLIILYHCGPYAMFLDNLISLWPYATFLGNIISPWFLSHISFPVCIPVGPKPCFFLYLYPCGSYAPWYPLDM